MEGRRRSIMIGKGNDRRPSVFGFNADLLDAQVPASVAEYKYVKPKTSSRLKGVDVRIYNCRIIPTEEQVNGVYRPNKDQLRTKEGGLVYVKEGDDKKRSTYLMYGACHRPGKPVMTGWQVCQSLIRDVAKLVEGSSAGFVVLAILPDSKPSTHPEKLEVGAWLVWDGKDFVPDQKLLVGVVGTDAEKTAAIDRAVLESEKEKNRVEQSTKNTALIMTSKGGKEDRAPPQQLKNAREAALSKANETILKQEAQMPVKPGSFSLDIYLDDDNSSRSTKSTKSSKSSKSTSRTRAMTDSSVGSDNSNLSTKSKSKIQDDDMIAAKKLLRAQGSPKRSKPTSTSTSTSTSSSINVEGEKSQEDEIIEVDKANSTGKKPHRPRSAPQRKSVFLSANDAESLGKKLTGAPPPNSPSSMKFQSQAMDRSLKSSPQSKVQTKPLPETKADPQQKQQQQQQSRSLFDCFSFC